MTRHFAEQRQRKTRMIRITSVLLVLELIMCSFIWLDWFWEVDGMAGLCTFCGLFHIFAFMSVSAVILP